MSALVQLSEALTTYTTTVDRDGMALEKVAVSSLLLFARSNHYDFNLNVLCTEGHQVDCMVQGGPTVELWTDVESFPWSSPNHRPPLSAVVTDLITRLNNASPDCRGVVFRPTNQHNMCGDVYGLFRKVDGRGYALLVLQCKDWFIAAGKLEKKWDESRKELPTNHLGDLDLKDDGLIVTPIFLLFSSNGLSENKPLQKNCGVVSILSMRNWLPTASYACEMAQKLQQIYQPSQ